MKILGEVLGAFALADEMNKDSGRKLPWVSPLSKNRIIACLNACAGMTDPSAEIAALRASHAALLAALKDAMPALAFNAAAEKKQLSHTVARMQEIYNRAEAAIAEAETV